MCGRFVSASPPDQIARYFDAVDETGTDPREREPRYNVAPTDDVFAVLLDGDVRKLESLHWGFVPHWAKDPSVGNRMINARAESVADSGAFKYSFQKRRCLIPADGFYEWKPISGQKAKQPMFIHRADGEPMAFAGLWTIWRNKADTSQELHSCTIITGEPNEAVAEVHDRMPVILPPSAWETWLSPAVDDVDLLGRLLVPAPASIMELYPVSTDVNNVRNDGPHLMARAEPIAVSAPTLAFDESRS